MMAVGPETFAIILLAGLAAGWLAGLVTRGRGFGLAGNSLVALLGAIAGCYVSIGIGIAGAGDLLAQTVAALIGAFALLYVVSRFRR